ncbi:MAG: trigger factor [Gammaproteobacteria bacterium]|nr:trigger factor [Gammaproteobacteria bacterium]
MQISVEAKEGLERQLTVQVPAERIDETVASRLKSLMKTARLDGFRPGKVPLKVVQKRFGEQVRQEVMGDMIQTTFQEALDQEKIRPAGMPQINPSKMELSEGAGLAYTATFEVYPEFKISGTESISVERPQVEVGDADLEKMIDNLRKQRLQWDAADRAAEDGDRLTIDFTGFIDGEKFEGGSAESTPLILGSNSMIDGFESQLVGVSAGDEKSIEVTFPENYQAEKLAGKVATFEIKVHKIEASQLPEMSEAFVKEMGIESGDVEELRSGAKDNMQREMQQAVKKKIKQQVMDGLLAQNPIDVPKALVQEEIEALRKQMVQQMSEYAPDADGSSFSDDIFRDEGTRRVKLGLIIADVVSQAKLKPSEEKVREMIESIAAPYEDPQQVVNYYYSNKEMLNNVEAVVLEEAVVDWVMDQAQVSEKAMSFDEIMNPAKPSAAAGE